MNESPGLTDAFAWQQEFLQFDIDGRTELLSALYVSKGYFDLTAQHVTRSSGPNLPRPDPTTLILGENFWRHRMGAESALIGKAFRLGKASLTVRGVSDFPGLIVGFPPDMIIPIDARPAIRGRPKESLRRYYVHVMARRAPGWGLEQVHERLRILWPELLRRSKPPGDDLERWTRSAGEQVVLSHGARGFSRFREKYGTPLIVVLASSGFLLLSAGANMANLLVAWNLQRRPEILTRISLGATRMNLLRQFLSEALILTAAGGGIGLLIANWGAQAMKTFLPPGNMPMNLDTGLDFRIFGFMLLILALTGLLFGLYPAVFGSRLRSYSELGAGFRSTTESSGVHAGRLLLGSQIALSLILAVAASVFLRNFVTLSLVDVGFRSEGVLLVSLVKKAHAPEPVRKPRYLLELLGRIRSIEGVRAAGISDREPLGFGVGRLERVAAVGVEKRQGSAAGAHVQCAFPGFFESLEIPLLRGRDFTDGEAMNAGRVAVVNARLATQLFGRDDAIGKGIEIGEESERKVVRIVGVARDVKYGSLREAPTGYVYIPCTLKWPEQTLLSVLTVVIGTESGIDGGRLRGLQEAIRDEVDLLNRQVVFGIKSVSANIRESILEDRMKASLCSVFAVFAMLVVAVGTYGVARVLVNGQSREIGVRLALGATPGRIVRQFMRDLVKVLTIGVALGCTFIFGARPFIENRGLGLDMRDPLMVLVPVFGVSAVFILASYSAVRRVLRISPMRVLRSE